MLDLSALEEKPAAVAQPTGKPLDIPLIDIDEDPEQPRREFTPEAMQEMTDSVALKRRRFDLDLAYPDVVVVDQARPHITHHREKVAAWKFPLCEWP